MKDTVKYALSGALAGIANGLFGAGGGLFLVPLLTGWCKMDEKKAFATSVAIILPMSVASFALFWIKNGFPVSSWPYIVGGILGGGASALLFRRLPALWLHRLFGVLILFGAIKAVIFP